MEHAVSLIRFIFYSRSAIVCFSYGIEIPNPVHRPHYLGAVRPSYLGTFVVGNFQIRFDLINFFAMFCMETNQAPRVVLKERGAKLEAFLRGMEI